MELRVTYSVTCVTNMELWVIFSVTDMQLWVISSVTCVTKIQLRVTPNVTNMELLTGEKAGPWFNIRVLSYQYRSRNEIPLWR